MALNSSGSDGWGTSLSDTDLPHLAPVTRQVLLRFVNCANRRALHPKDELRFHGFVRFAHAQRCRMTRPELEAVLLRAAFAPGLAQSLALRYEQGRALLKTHCPRVWHGQVHFF